MQTRSVVPSGAAPRKVHVGAVGGQSLSVAHAISVGPVPGQSCEGRQLTTRRVVSTQQESPNGQSAGTRHGRSVFSQPSSTKFWTSMQRATSGDFFRQQTWGGSQTAVP